MRSDEPFDFAGAYYPLQDALLLPRPKRRGGPPIVIGGNGPKRTLPLAARYADEWNAVYVSADRFAELNAELGRLLAEYGRLADSVRRTLMTRVVIGQDDEAAEGKVDGDVQALRGRGVLIGEPARLVEAFEQLREAGVQRVMAQWLDLDDIDGLELLAKAVLARL
jgi:alkanesulfonate monooxygenase SsuD/methylene tetrahydromethanopterin reductase-like flavin-dependent oxidoreductase (luciferase family)